MYKKFIYQNLLKLSVLSLTLLSVSSCVITGNCYRVGYSQEIESTFVDQTSKQGYFVYSYLQDKNNKNYSVYSLSLDGKAKKILDLGTKNYNTQNYFNYDMSHKFTAIGSDKLFMREHIRNANQESRSFNYLINTQTDEIIYKTESKGYFFIDSMNKMSNDKKYLLDSDKTIFDIEKGNYITNPENYFLAKWIGNTNYIFNFDYMKKIYIYEVKDNKINKVGEYQIKDDKFKYIEPINFTDNVLEFASDISKESENIYKLDISKEELTLIKNVARENQESNILQPENKLFLGASKKIYLEELIYKDNSPYSQGIKKTAIFDYLNELPKGFYSDQLICGNYPTTDKIK